MTETSPADSRPPWDSALALSLVAKRVLVGINYCDHNDNLLEQRQVYGTIIKADANDGFAIRLEGQKEGELFRLPPDIRAFHRTTAPAPAAQRVCVRHHDATHSSCRSEDRRSLRAG